MDQKIKILKNKGMTLIKSKLDDNRLFDLRIILIGMYLYLGGTVL